MSTLIGINVKDSAIWLPRLLRQVEKLEGEVNRIIIMYGISSDATFSILDHWRRTSKHKVDVYAEPNLPLNERGGAATLARVEQDIQSLLRDGGEKYYLKLDADLVHLPEDLIPYLIKHNLDLVAPYVWTEGWEQKTFFDVYGFRKDGCRFHPTRPPMGIKPIPIDCVGTCFLAKREAALAGVYSNPYPLIQFCYSVKAKGFQVWADPSTSVEHVDLERYGIRHYPLPVSLSNTYYVTDTNEHLSPEQLQVETFYGLKKNYDSWLSQNREEDVDWVKRFNTSRPLLTASYKVLNEGRFLEHSLESVYPYVDRIDIVEGAIKEAMPTANKNGSSTDDTVDIIQGFPDPDSKIRLIQGKWKTREQMQAKLLELCMGKWMLFIDGDEILDGGEEMRRFCTENQDGSIVHAKPDRFYNFWHDFNHIAYSLNPLSPWAKYGIPHAFLVWRDLPGLNFLQSHTIAMDAYGTSVSTTYLDATTYDKHIKTLDGVHVYHFGNAKGVKAMKDKLVLPHLRLLGEAKEDPWFSGVMPVDMVLEEFSNDFPEALLNHPDREKQRIRIIESKPTFRFELVEGAYS